MKKEEKRREEKRTNERQKRIGRLFQSATDPLN